MYDLYYEEIFNSISNKDQNQGIAGICIDCQSKDTYCNLFQNILI